MQKSFFDVHPVSLSLEFGASFGNLQQLLTGRTKLLLMIRIVFRGMSIVFRGMSHQSYREEP